MSGADKLCALAFGTLARVVTSASRCPAQGLAQQRSDIKSMDLDVYMHVGFAPSQKRLPCGVLFKATFEPCPKGCAGWPCLPCYGNFLPVVGYPALLQRFIVRQISRCPLGVLWPKWGCPLHYGNERKERKVKERKGKKGKERKGKKRKEKKRKPRKGKERKGKERKGIFLLERQAAGPGRSTAVAWSHLPWYAYS
jgi:hypothetical protein